VAGFLSATPPFRTRIKVCCIRSVAEAEIAIQHGAAALGLVSAMPSGPGVIEEHEIAAIAARVPPGVASFLLTSQPSVDAIIDQQRRTGVNTIQLVDALPLGSHRRLRAALPGIALVQVVHVLGPASVEEALAIAPEVDALLLDSGNPNLAVKELGGTGRTHDWNLSREIVTRAPCPTFLAGGLTPSNVADAIRQVRPYGVDLCTGVRSAGALDPTRLVHFVHAVEGAFG